MANFDEFVYEILDRRHTPVPGKSKHIGDDLQSEIERSGLANICEDIEGVGMDDTWDGREIATVRQQLGSCY
jgi:hypothetical protein